MSEEDKITTTEETNEVKEDVFNEEKLTAIFNEIIAATGEDNNFVEHHITLFNIYLYKIFDVLLNNKNKSQEALMNMLNSALEQVFILVKQNAQVIPILASRYFDIQKGLDQDKDNTLDIIYLIGSASELQGEAHLNALDTMLLLVTLFEGIFKISWYDIKNSLIPYLEAKN